MSLPGSPPGVTAYTLRRGASGWAVYALQRGLLALGHKGLGAADGDFGRLTERAVSRFQAHAGLGVDGIAGPVTQAELTADVCALLERQLLALPKRLPRNMALAEGGGYVGAVNWSVPGGVDCGLFQRRVYGPPWQVAALADAFCPQCSGATSMRAWLTARDSYLGRAWVAGSPERAGRCALLAHNWPAGADSWSRTGHTSSPSRTATWVPAGVRFPDGAPVRTWDEWAQFYAMGGPHGEAALAKGVQW